MSHDVSQGQTVLHMAAKQDLATFVKPLLDAGADVHTRDYEVMATVTSGAAWLTCG